MQSSGSTVLARILFHGVSDCLYDVREAQRTGWHKSMMPRLWWQSKYTILARDLRFTLFELCRRLRHDYYVLLTGYSQGRPSFVSAVGRSTRV